MYTIEYYKTKREKPIIKEPEYSYDNRLMNIMMYKRYLHQKDLNDKCWNIKSLTIDLEDIKKIIKDRNLRSNHLISLYSRVMSSRFDDSINSITILNNNITNKIYIYEIINCKWMINANEEISNKEIIIIVRKLLTLLEQYEKATDRNKIIIKDEIDIIKYYLDTIINKSNEKTDSTAIKLGKHFIKRN